MPFALLLALAGCSASADDPASGEDPGASPLLYEIASADGEVEGWLLGTIHALPHRVTWRTPEIEKAISSADILVVEVAALGDSGEISAIFNRLSQSEGLPGLAQRVDPALRDELATMISRSDRAESSFEGIEDWAAAIILARVDAPGQPRYGVDRAVIEVFAGREVRGLETAEQQLRIFDALSPEDQTDLLEGTVRDWKKTRQDPVRLQRAWLCGDLAALEASSREGILADPGLREALLVGRNERWLDALLPLLETDSKPLIAVGTAHIVGEDGLPPMLEARGFSVRRISEQGC
jgi:uncharacterized protein YbaP (TraB family)